MKNVLEHIKVNHIFHLDKSKMDITYFHHRLLYISSQIFIFLSLRLPSCAAPSFAIVWSETCCASSYRH